MTAAVLEWKTKGYNALDIAAWNLYAKGLKVKQSGFNAFNSLKINAAKAGKTWEALYNYIFLVAHSDWAQVEIHSNTNQNAKLYLGTSKTVMLTEYSGNYEYTGQYHWDFSPDGLEEGTKYYFYIKNTAANERARTGIYSFTTLKTVTYIIDQFSAKGQKIIYLNTTAGLTADMAIKIGFGLPTEEEMYIESVQEGISITGAWVLFDDHDIGELCQIV